MGLKTSKDRVEVSESQLIGFDVNRPLFYWIILTISVMALIGNLFVVKTVISRKYKHLQKTCIISLAVSDIMTVILFAMNNLDLLSKKTIAWIYGEFICHYLPVGQVLGNLTSSVALLVIALDRYHNVIYALSKKWNPALWKCLCGALILWIFCTGLSYPIVTFYIYIPISMDGQDTALCSGAPVTKDLIFTYYICMNCLFFIPIVAMFFWFYYKIALLIWRHRKPQTEKCSQQEISETSSETRTEPEAPKSSVRVPTKKKNVQMERKIRSFKIVLALIVAFIGCRLPYWTVMLCQQLSSGDRNMMWSIRFACICLYLLNCALNPFLYTYLNITIVICRKVNAFVTNTCCCWFSNSDFEDFETGKNMSEAIMGVNKNSALANNNGKPLDNTVRVKFIDVPVMPKYIQREI